MLIEQNIEFELTGPEPPGRTCTQCRRQSKQSEGALAESGRALILTELLRIKTDLQILCSYKYA